MSNRLADGGGGMDPGLSQLLQGVMQTAPQSGAQAPAGAFPGANTAQQPYSLADIEQLLAGLGRSSQTTAPYVGSMPSWVPQPVRKYVRQGVLDPYVGTGQNPGSWRVYMGRAPARDVARHRPTPPAGGGGYPGAGVASGGGYPGANANSVPSTTRHKAAHDKTVTIQQAANEPYLWDSNQVASAIKKFQAAGVAGVTDFDTLTKAWGGLVQRAGSMYSLSSGKRKVTPWDVLDLYKTEQEKAGITPAPLGPGDPGFNGSVSHVTRTVSTISKGDAWTALQQTLSHMLGRDPSDQELRDFTYRMNSLASSDPSITKTIEKYKNGQVASTTNHTNAGFDSNDIAQQAYNKAQSDPDHAEFQAATTYYNAALSALGPIGG